MWTDTDGCERIRRSIGHRGGPSASYRSRSVLPWLLRAASPSGKPDARRGKASPPAQPACSARLWMQAGERQEALYAARVALRTVRVTGMRPARLAGPCWLPAERV